MPTFTYKAVDFSGKPIEGEMEAKSAEIIKTKLQDQNFFPLQIQAKAAGSGLSREISFASVFNRVRSRDVMNFTQQMAVLAKAGLPLDRSLSILTQLGENARFKSTIEEVRKSVHSGATFSDSLGKHPRVFSRLYVNMVRSGEEGGALDKILVRLAQFLHSSQELKDYVISAMIYPILLTIVGSVAMAILMVFVVPKFTAIFSSAKMELPLPTQIVIGVSHLLSHHYLLLTAGAAGLVALFRFYTRSEKGAAKWDDLKLRIPLFGSLIRRMEVARFTRTMGTLVQGGVPILKAISIVKDTITNSVIRNALTDVSSGLKEGSRVAGKLMESGVFPDLAVHMITVGEETGDLAPMLINVADTYDNEVRSTIKQLVSMLEPALILAMGLLVGFVVIAVLMAIFGVYDIPI